MTNVQISTAQFEVKLVKSFDEFQQQVEELIAKAPLESDYVCFPELFTIGLVGTFEEELGRPLEQADLPLVDKFTEDFKQLFSRLAKERKQIIIAGSHLEQREDKFYNITYIFDEEGEIVGEHAKTHIFPAESGWNTSEGEELNVFDVGPVKIGIANCYESEIPEISRILAMNGADIIFSPSYTFAEAGFWRVRHCSQARAIENQTYHVHVPTVSVEDGPIPSGYGCSSIISPCDSGWSPNGVVVESERNTANVATGVVNMNQLFENRKSGAATTYHDRTRRAELYKKYEPYKSLQR